MMLVVVYHSVLLWTETWYVKAPIFKSTILSVFAQWLNSFHIYGFALVSGYLFYYLRYEKGKYSKFVPFLANKVKRLLVPYVFTSLIWVIPFTVYFFRINKKEIVSRFALGISPGQLWFLLMLFCVFVIVYPISDILKKYNVRGGILVILIYGVGIIGDYLLPNVYQIFTACTYLSFFYLGFKIRQHSDVVEKLGSPLMWVFTDVGLFAVSQIIINKMEGFIVVPLTYFLNFVLHIVGAIMAFKVLQSLANRINWNNSKAFSVLKDYAMPIYLFHSQVIYITVDLLNGVLNPYIHVIINFFVAMMISLILSFVLKRFKLTKALIGEK